MRHPLIVSEVPGGVLCIAAIGVALCVSTATAQPRALGTPQRSEAEFLVPPQGGAFDVPVHVRQVCILSFGEKLSKQALASSPDFEIKSWGDDGVAIRALSDAAKPTTVAIATTSGVVKVNVTLNVAPPDKPAYTLVRFKAVSAEEAFDAQLKAEVARRVAPLEAELGRLRQNLETHIRDRADGLIAARLLQRNEAFFLSAHERSDDGVIVHVTRGLIVGGDGYLVFEIENRTSSVFRLAGVRVQADGQDLQGPAQLTTPSNDRDQTVIGVVPPRTSSHGIVVVHAVDQVLGKSLAMTVSGPSGTQPIQIARGIVFR